MVQPKYIGLELIINKFSEFIEWMFERRKKSEYDKLVELNLLLKNRFDFTIFDVSENPVDVLKIKLEKVDARILDDIISSLFQILISKNQHQTFKRLSNAKLKERIMEIILFTENKYGKLSIELCNIKNSLHHKLH